MLQDSIFPQFSPAFRKLRPSSLTAHYGLLGRRDCIGGILRYLSVDGFHRHLHRQKVHRTKNCRERSVSRIATRSDANQTRLWREARRVKNIPASVEISLKLRMEIGWLEGIRVTGYKSRRDAHRSAESNSEMSKIAAYASTLGSSIENGSERIGAPAQVLDIVMNPVANRGHARKAWLQFAELMLRQAHQLVRFAVAARIKVRDHVSGQ